MEVTGELVTAFKAIVGDGPSRQADLIEFCNHIHNIQNMILAQAAAREYPDLYRLMGDERDRNDN